MDRRKFFGTSLIAALGMAAGRAAAAVGLRPQQQEPTGDVDPETIDPYFLESADVPPAEKENILSFMKYQEDAMDGRPAVIPRGGKPKRAPTYRFLHWQGALGDPRGRLVGPLSITPVLEGSGPFALNAQILGFNASSMDWLGNKGAGALSIEIRARYMGEPMTWLYLEQFETTKGGGNSVGLEYVAQRNGMPDHVIAEEPIVDIRIQLIRNNKSKGIFRKVLKVGSYLTGLPLGGGGGESSGALSFQNSAPVMRVPQMVREGVAFAQGTVAGMSEEAPVWKSGFSSLALTPDAGRLVLKPGLWLAIDDSKEIDFSAMKLADIGGSVGVLADGKPVDLNYLVMDFLIENIGEEPQGRGEIIRKGG